jgi:hypothetical protein
MVSLASLWLPILISAVIVFIASSIIHMLLRYHASDFRKIPEEDEVMEALRKIGVPTGDYMIPYCGDSKTMKSPEFIEKMTKGPVAVMTVMPSGPPAMGKPLVFWFVYCVVVGIFAAYITGRAAEPGDDYLSVFRFAGTTAFIGYTLAIWQNAIWYKRSLGATLKTTFDGLIYGLLTAGTFGWLWPSV